MRHLRIGQVSLFAWSFVLGMRIGSLSSLSAASYINLQNPSLNCVSISKSCGKSSSKNSKSEYCIGLLVQAKAENIKYNQRLIYKNIELVRVFLNFETMKTFPEGEFKRMTGITVPQFDVLMAFLDERIAMRLKYKYDAGTPLKDLESDLTSENRLLITLLRLRGGRDEADLATFFKTSVSTVSAVFNTSIQFMYFQFKRIQSAMFVKKDLRKRKDRPLPFKPFNKFRVCLDTTEVEIERPVFELIADLPHFARPVYSIEVAQVKTYVTLIELFFATCGREWGRDFCTAFVMPPNQPTYFKSEWLNVPEFKHIKEAKSNTDAYCTLCKKTFKLSSMGSRALTSHINGEKHKKRVQIQESTPDIRIFSAEKAVRSRSADGKDPDDPPEALAQQNAGGASASSTSGSTAPVTPASASDSSDMQRRLDRYLKKDDVTIAEILWCLQSVENHTSASATGKQSVLFPRMFPDSKIAACMSLGRTKTGYGLVYGLAPYFKNKLLGSLRESGAFVVAFDESLNKLGTGIFASDEVQSHYYSSAFLGRARAVHLLDAFKSELSELNLDNLEQISMDGPNVNWSFLKEFEADRRMCTGSSSPMFINMGSCGLHVVNNSFKTGAQATNWNVVPFLRSIYWVFKDSPTRR
ncbi:hypothetical protein FOCC_FOCC012267, partial [Frankliniella occidentalis]